MAKQNGAITIDKGVPMPRAGSHRSKYPLRDMKVGDSIVVPSASARASVWVQSKRLGIRMTSTELDAGAYRIWRIA